jgi:hypothetical protein
MAAPLPDLGLQILELSDRRVRLGGREAQACFGCHPEMLARRSVQAA